MIVFCTILFSLYLFHLLLTRQIRHFNRTITGPSPNKRQITTFSTSFLSSFLYPLCSRHICRIFLRSFPAILCGSVFSSSSARSVRFAFPFFLFRWMNPPLFSMSVVRDIIPFFGPFSVFFD